MVEVLLTTDDRAELTLFWLAYVTETNMAAKFQSLFYVYCNNLVCHR